MMNVITLNNYMTANELEFLYRSYQSFSVTQIINLHVYVKYCIKLLDVLVNDLTYESLNTVADFNYKHSVDKYFSGLVQWFDKASTRIRATIRRSRRGMTTTSPRSLFRCMLLLIYLLLFEEHNISKRCSETPLNSVTTKI